MKKNTQIILSLGVLLSFFTASATLLTAPVVAQTPSPNIATTASPCDNNRFLTMPPWYRGVASGSNCDIDLNNLRGDDRLGGSIGTFLVIVGLNIVEILMHIAAYTAAAFIIVGGFKYMTSMGSADGNVKGRKTIMNAVIGLIISMIAITVVSYIVNALI